MRYIIILIFLTSCSSLPQFYQTLEDVADDTAIKCEISKEAFTQDSRVRVIIEAQKIKDEK